MDGLIDPFQSCEVLDKIKAMYFWKDSSQEEHLINCQDLKNKTAKVYESKGQIKPIVTGIGWIW